MKSYDTLKKIGSGLRKAAMVGVASYALCEGCTYSGSHAYAKEKAEIAQENPTPAASLEIILEK